MAGRNWGRRHFLRSLAGSAAGIGLMGSFEEVAASVDTAVGGVRNSVSGGLDSSLLRREYLLDPDVVYLNHASIGTIPRAVHEARVEYLRRCESNPWLHMWGGAWEGAREDARGALADYLGSRPERIALTHNTTEGFNLLASGLPLGPGDEVLFSELNHDGASLCFERWGARKGYAVRRAPFPLERAQELDADAVLAATLEPIGPRTRVLVLPHVDNMVGIRAPLARVVAGAKARGVEWVLVDGAQTAGMIPLELDASGVDAYAGSPHKWLQAPKGLGFLHLSDGIREVLEPMWTTWGQARWEGARRYEDYGTRNLAEVLALHDAVRWQVGLEEGGAKRDRLAALRRELMARVDADPGLRWRSPRGPDAGCVLVAIEVVGASASEMGGVLARDHGVILRAFGGERLNTLRVSPATVTTDAEIDRFFEIVGGARG